MLHLSKAVWAGAVVLACTWAVAQGASGQSVHGQIQRVTVLKSQAAVEIEIQATQPFAPRTQMVANPDRLVIDFPYAMPGPQLRGLQVNRGDVKAVRVGLFESSPPTTRVVLDLTSPVGYQIFPSGKSVIVKLGAQAAPAPVAVVQPEPAPVEPAKPAVKVAYRNGLLSVNADKATLAQVLYEIHNQTGAEIAVPAGAEQEPVVAALGPAAPKDVLGALLNGSPYNFILIGSASDPNALERVLLSNKGTPMAVEMAPAPTNVTNTPASPSPTTLGRLSSGRSVPLPGGPDQTADMPADDEPQPSDPQPADPQTGGQSPQDPPQQ